MYEQGVLRLMQPIMLPEGTRVDVTVTPKVQADLTSTPAEILAAIAAKAVTRDAEEYSSRDHDRLLYGN
jgi:predicted DNA-binding antitoxin AbrB/MazE fold protein